MKNPVLDMFFKYDKLTNISKCSVQNCTASLKGKHGSNLEKHIFAYHKTQYVELQNAKSNTSDTSISNSATAEKLMTNFMKKQCITINMSEQILLTACVELVTMNGRPLTMMKDSGFRKIIDPILVGLGSQANCININEHNIKKHISDTASNIISTITQDMDNKLVSLKVDGVTRHNKSFLGINVQYMLGNTMDLRIKTLAIFELTQQNTDNDLTQFENEIGNAVNSLPTTSKVRCAAHSLNLAIEEALKITSVQNVLARARAVVKKLRRPTFATLLKRQNKKFAIRDIETRWSSVYDMLLRLCELKDFCLEFQETMPELLISISNWNRIEEMVDTLKPAKIGLVQLQKEDITLSDFFAIWWNVIAKLKKKNSILSNALQNTMQQRQILLFANPTFAAVTYLDPRFQCILDADQKSIAKDHLVKTWNTILEVEGNVQSSQSDVVETQVQMDENIDNEMDDLEVFFTNSKQQLYRISNYFSGASLNSYIDRRV
ncbi:hypothetical protein ACI65C_013567 [Semiaphis heraclei]